MEIEDFKKWLEKESDSWPFYDLTKRGELSIEIDGGYGGYFWESFALKAVNLFKGIVFDGVNQMIWDDHLIGTSFECDGKEVTLKRWIELPSDCADEVDEEYEEEIEDMKAFFEAENGIPYSEKFSVNEVMACHEIYESVAKKLKDKPLVEATCKEHNIPKERFMKYANILNFEKRK